MTPEFGYTTPKSEPRNLDECQQAPRYEDGADYECQQDILAQSGPVEPIECDLDENPLLLPELRCFVPILNAPPPIEEQFVALIRTSFYAPQFLGAPYHPSISFDILRPAFAHQVAVAEGQLPIACARYNYRVMNYNDNVSCFGANVSAYKRSISIFGLVAAYSAYERDGFGGHGFISRPPNPQVAGMAQSCLNGVPQNCALLPELIAVPESQYRGTSGGDPSPKAASEPVRYSGIGTQYINNGAPAPALFGTQSNSTFAARDANNFDHEIFPLNIDDEDIPLEDADFQTLLQNQPAQFWFPEQLEGFPVEMPQGFVNDGRQSEAVSPRTQVPQLTRVTQYPMHSGPRANFVTRMVGPEFVPAPREFIQVYDETVEGEETERYLTIGAVWDYLIAKAAINCVDHDKVNILLIMMALRGKEVNHGYGPAYAQSLVNDAWDNTPMHE